MSKTSKISTVSIDRNLSIIGQKLKAEWKNIYRRLLSQNLQNHKVNLQELEKVAFKHGVFMSIDELKLIENRFGALIDIDVMTKELDL